MISTQLSQNLSVYSEMKTISMMSHWLVMIIPRYLLINWCYQPVAVTLKIFSRTIIMHIHYFSLMEYLQWIYKMSWTTSTMGKFKYIKIVLTNLWLYLFNIFTILRLSQGTLVQQSCQCVYKSAILTILHLLSRKLDLIRKTSQVWAAPATVPPSDPNIQKSNQYWS